MADKCNGTVPLFHLTSMMLSAFAAKSAVVSFVADLALLTGLTIPACAQRVQPQPVTDSAAQASPLTAVPHAPVDDASSQASPITQLRAKGATILPSTAIAIALGQDIDSGKLKQGQDVQAELTAPVAVQGSATLPVGTPVVLTVIETVPAGRIMAQGEFSLQVIRVGSVGVYTNTLVFDGKPGHQDLPDSAPALGTDAGLASGAPLTFQVQPSPTAAEKLPQDRENGPGSVNGVASGGPPPPSTLKSTFDQSQGAEQRTGGANLPSSQRSVTPGDTTTDLQTQRLGQPSVAPNQPKSPVQPLPGPTTPR